MTSLEGTFQPQVWVNDNAVDDGPSQTFDAGAALLRLRADQFRRIVGEAHKEWGGDLDELAFTDGLAGRGAYDGPFTVEVDAHDLTDFLVEVGITDLDAVTDESLAALRMELAGSASSPAL